MKKEFFKRVFKSIYFYILLVLLLFIDYYFSWQYTLIDGIIALFVISIFLMILFAVLDFINNGRKKPDFPIKSWKWVVYIIGWASVLQPFFLVFQLFLQPVFWTFQGLLYFQEKRKTRFFSENFHKGVYYWGWITIVGLLVIFSFMLWMSYRQ